MRARVPWCLRVLGCCVCTHACSRVLLVRLKGEGRRGGEFSVADRPPTDSNGILWRADGKPEVRAGEHGLMRGSACGKATDDSVAFSTPLYASTV